MVASNPLRYSNSRPILHFGRPEENRLFSSNESSIFAINPACPCEKQNRAIKENPFDPAVWPLIWDEEVFHPHHAQE
jgi:hypothetical protein